MINRTTLIVDQFSKLNLPLTTHLLILIITVLTKNNSLHKRKTVNIRLLDSQISTFAIGYSCTSFETPMQTHLDYTPKISKHITIHKHTSTAYIFGNLADHTEIENINLSDPIKQVASSSSVTFFLTGIHSQIFWNFVESGNVFYLDLEQKSLKKLEVLKIPQCSNIKQIAVGPKHVLLLRCMFVTVGWPRVRWWSCF